MTTPLASPAATPKPAAAAAPDPAQLKKAAQAFEAVFMRQMIASMRTASLGDDILGSSATEQFRDMSDSRLADSMSQTGKGFGIADMLVSRLGGKAAAPAATTGSGK